MEIPTEPRPPQKPSLLKRTVNLNEGYRNSFRRDAARKDDEKRSHRAKLEKLEAIAAKREAEKPEEKTRLRHAEEIDRSNRRERVEKPREMNHDVAIEDENV